MGAVFVAVAVCVGVALLSWLYRTERGRAVDRLTEYTTEEDALVALDALAPAFARRGYVTRYVRSTRREASKGTDTWVFAFNASLDHELDVSHTGARESREGEAVLEILSTTGEGSCRVGTRAWSERVPWRGVGDRLLAGFGPYRLKGFGVHGVVLDAVERKVSFGLRASDVAEDAPGVLDELFAIVSAFDACVSSDEDGWFERLEPVMEKAPSEAAASYLRERVARGHMTPEGAIAWFLERNVTGYQGLDALLSGASPEALMDAMGMNAVWSHLARAYWDQHEASEAFEAFSGFMARPRLLAWATRNGETGTDHRVVAALVGAASGVTLEDPDVVDGLVDQIEGAPVGSDAAVVDALEGRVSTQLQRRLLERVRGADPLSPLSEAARRLCDPERLSGALSVSGPGVEGGLTEAPGGKGGVTQVE